MAGMTCGNCMSSASARVMPLCLSQYDEFQAVLSVMLRAGRSDLIERLLSLKSMSRQVTKVSCH